MIIFIVFSYLQYQAGLYSEEDKEAITDSAVLLKKMVMTYVRGRAEVEATTTTTVDGSLLLIDGWFKCAFSMVLQ